MVSFIFVFGNDDFVSSLDTFPEPDVCVCGGWPLFVLLIICSLAKILVQWIPLERGVGSDDDDRRG